MKLMTRLVLTDEELSTIEAAYEIVSKIYCQSISGSEMEDMSASAAMNLNALVNCAKGALCDQHKPWMTL